MSRPPRPRRDSEPPRYFVVTDEVSAQQIDALPVDAQGAFAELWALLETDPWIGRSYRREDPGLGMRTHTFGSYGMTTYSILEDQLRVDILLVQWAG